MVRSEGHSSPEGITYYEVKTKLQLVELEEN
jgi:hypothetical protein